MTTTCDLPIDLSTKRQSLEQLQLEYLSQAQHYQQQAALCAALSGHPLYSLYPHCHSYSHPYQHSHLHSHPHSVPHPHPHNSLHSHLLRHQTHHLNLAAPHAHQLSIDNNSDGNCSETDSSKENHHLSVNNAPSSSSSSSSESGGSESSAASPFVASTSSTSIRNKKRINRPLTGKHVKQGTGAQVATLLKLRNHILERKYTFGSPQISK